MGRRRRLAPPTMRRHRQSGQAYVFIDGRQVYLGKFGSAEAARQYRKIVDQWEATHGPTPSSFPVGTQTTVLSLTAAYLAHAAVYYRRRDGSMTEEVGAFRRALEPICRAHGELSPDEFKPRHFYGVIEQWVKDGLLRQTINKNIGRVKKVWSWGVTREMVSGPASYEVQLVERLQRGRTKAQDYGEVSPAPVRDVVQVLRVLRDKKNQTGRRNSLAAAEAMVLTIYYCGPRPGEVVRMRADEVFQNVVKIGERVVPLRAGVWAFVPYQSKNEAKGKFTMYVIGPRLQRVLEPFIVIAKANKEQGGYLFPTRFRPYGTVFSFNDTIERACHAAGVPPWTPNQLRHLFLTRMDRIAGLQMASSLVSHASLATTAGYVEKNLPGMAELAARIG